MSHGECCRRRVHCRTPLVSSHAIIESHRDKTKAAHITLTRRSGRIQHQGAKLRTRQDVCQRKRRRLRMRTLRSRRRSLATEVLRRSRRASELKLCRKSLFGVGLIDEVLGHANASAFSEWKTELPSTKIRLLLCKKSSNSRRRETSICPE